MSYNGSGTFVINSAGMPLVPFQRDLSATFNALTADLATGLSTAITKDGQTTTTALITFAAGISSTLVTDATSISTGSLLTSGGLGVTKAAWIGGLINVAGAATLQSTLAVTGAATLSSTISFTGSTFTLDQKSNTAFATPAALSATGSREFASTVSGAVLMGFGTTNDVSLMNRAGTVCLGVGPNTTAINIPGTLGSGAISITGTSAGNMLKIVASASGTMGDATYQSWYRANGTTRKGYFGFAGADTADITLATEESGGTLQFYTAGAQVGQFTAGGYLKASPDPAILFNATAATHELIGNSSSVGALRIRSQNASFAGTAALVYVDRAASTLYNLLDLQSGTVSKFLVDGTGNTTISGTVQPTLSLAKTNATAATWQIYNNGNLVFYDGTNYPLYFTGADSTFGGIINASSYVTTTAYFWAKGVGAAGGLFLGSGGSSSGHISQASDGGSSTTTYIGNQTITTSSDMRLKENIVPTTRNALDLLNQWEIVDHTWNDPSDQCENNRNMRGVWTGVIAQQVQPITPWLVNKPLTDVDENGEINNWNMDFGYAVPLLVKAIQEISAEFQYYKNSHP